MGPLTRSGSRLRQLLLLVTLASRATYAQTPPVLGTCAVTAVPTQVRGEGLTERTGDILLSCSGSLAGSVLSGNLQVFLPVSISNRVDSNNLTTDAMVSVDYGSGFVPTGIAGRVSNQIIAFNGLSITVPPSGGLSLKISNIRAAVYQLGATVPQQIQAQLSFSSTASILLNQSQLTVAYAQPGLLLTMSDKGNITCAGSPAPSSISVSGLFSAKTAFASTRVTEGFAAAFVPKASGDDTGTRFLVKYSGFPAGAHLYLPDYVAGSDALVPTAGGDLGLLQAVGQYAAGSGALLLQRVQFANADGSGGFPVTAPASGVVVLDSASEVPLTAGAGFAVYEVVAANPNLRETAQFPTFVGLAEVTAPAVARESITFAPLSTALAASTSAPVPRFAGTAAASDCSALGDCGAGYYPKLSVEFNPVVLTAIAGGAMSSQPGYIAINNAGGGTMPWTAIVSYQTGTGWIILDTASGQNNGSVRVFAKTQGLAAGTYTANVVIDAGGLAGTFYVPVTLVVSPAPTLPTGGTGTGHGHGTILRRDRG